MTFNVGSVGNVNNFEYAKTKRTKKNYMDFLKPAGMVNAKAIFKKLQAVNGTEVLDALDIGAIVGGQIQDLRGSELDQLWPRIEKYLNDRKTLKVNAETDVGRLITSIGLIYEAMEKIDQGDDINSVRALNSSYTQTRAHIESRFLGKQTGADRRTLQRALDTVDSYFGRVIDRFNDRVKAQEIAGSEIEV